MVLIETYWNVKRDQGLLLLPSAGINRNILECKEKKRIFLSVRVDCINRNILECKDYTNTDRTLRITVLIETYWNVKTHSTRVVIKEFLY